MMDLTEKLLYVTVQVCCDVDNGLSLGTGFIFTYARKNITFPVLVTNKHVVRGCRRVSLSIAYVHSDGGHDERRSFDTVINCDESAWVMHPEETIDLCAFPLMGILSQMREEDPSAHPVPLDESLIPTQAELDKLSPFEDVIMVGYPIGLIDKVHNAPLVRKGITATHLRYDFNGSPYFMIDCACFPGSSGSPVFLFDNGPYVEEGVLNLGRQRFKFLGIMYAGPQHNAVGDIEIINVPTSQRVIADTQIPMNLGNVIHARKLAELGEVLWKMAEPELGRSE